MYEKLNKKKLLVIGSDTCNLEIIRCAHEMGVSVVVTDGIKDRTKTPAKVAADEAWDIDYSDLDAIEKACIESSVDGVFAGYSEFRVLAACKIAERMGWPFYATQDQIDLTRNKRIFKDTCKKYNIPTPQDYCFHYPLREEEKENVHYPVIVKPADYAGRKGISVCNDPQELEAAVSYAASMSQSKTVIVEDYLTGVEFSSLYTLKDGLISLSCVNEKYITDDQERKSGLCEFLVSPANSYTRYMQELDEKLRAFLKGIDARNGVAFFQGMITKEKMYVFEMGYRINGNNDYQAIEKANGLNFMKMMIAHSLCGDMCDDLAKDNPLYDRYMCTLLYYVHAGKVGEFSYGEIDNHPQIRNANKYLWSGKEIHEDGSTAQRALSVKLEAKTLEEIAALVEHVNKGIYVKNEEGEDILFKKFDPQKLFL